MIYNTFFLAQLSRLAAAPSKSGNSFVLILVILVILALLIFCCLAVFFSLFIVSRKKTQRKNLSSSTRSEGERTMRKVLAQFPIYFKRSSPDQASQTRHNQSVPLETGSSVQASGIQNRQWLSLVEECVDLFDELERLQPDLNPVEREMALHVTSRLQEILTRSGVEVIAHDAFFDPTRHRLVPPGRALEVEQTPITIISPGFVVGRLVLRHARVRLTTFSSSSDE